MESKTEELVRNVPVGLELGLRNYWYPIVRSSALGSEPMSTTALGEDVVLWRDASGVPHAFPDWCPHRRVRLSLGRVCDDAIECPFHGLQFAGNGECVHIPWEEEGSEVLSEIAATSYPCLEVGGLIFTYIGDETAFPATEARTELPADLFDPTVSGFVTETEWNVNWLLALDGVDAHHLPVLHRQSAVAGYSGVNRDPKGGRIRFDIGDGSKPPSEMTDPDGQRLGAGKRGHDSEELFHIPSTFALGIEAKPNTPRYNIYLWFVPIDAGRVRVMRFVCRKIDSEADRAEWASFFKAVVEPRTRQVDSEDAMIGSGQRSLEFARSGEHLLGPDAQIFRRRLTVRDAFVGQSTGTRVAPRWAATGDQIEIPA